MSKEPATDESRVDADAVTAALMSGDPCAGHPKVAGPYRILFVSRGAFVRAPARVEAAGGETGRGGGLACWRVRE